MNTIRHAAHAVRRWARRLRNRARRADPHAVWAEALDGEIAFWDEYFATRGGERYGAYYQHRLDPEQPLQAFVAECLPPGPSSYHVLDVGAGPLTFLGKRLPDKDLAITAIDPLADAYDEILARYGVDPIVRTRKLEAEAIAAEFPPDTFDLAFARNSLDHAHDPVSAIRQMLQVVKPGCSVLLLHKENEADTQHWGGLHQWNFRRTGDRFCISGRRGTVDMTDLLRADADITFGYEPAFDGSTLLCVRMRRHG